MDSSSAPCYICGNFSNEIVTEEMRYECLSNGKVFRCKNCGLVFVFPRMTPDQERQFYEKEYGEIYSDEKGSTPADLFYKRQADAKLYFSWIKEFLNPDSDCLEIGCASGYFLHEIKMKVNSVTGIESHKLLCNYCNEIGIDSYSDLESAKGKKFDLIFLFFVLEHLGDPMAYLENLKQYLKPNGKILIVVPNIDDILIGTYEIEKIKQFYFTPAHQFYYSPKTLARIIKKAGYEKIELRFFQRYDLSNHIYWMMYHKPGGQGKYNNIFSEDLLREYEACLIKQEICDTILAVVSI